MILKFYFRFSKIRQDWDSLYKVTPDVSPFLATKAFAISLKYWYPYLLSRRAYYLFAVFSDNDGVKCIIPLIKNKSGCTIFGNENGFNECGCVYEDILIAESCFKQLKERTDAIRCCKISEHNILASIFSRNSLVSSTSCVAIDFFDGYLNWFKGLSASVRQNMRTSYNRLEKDGFSFEFTLLNQDQLPINEIIELYTARHSNRYSVKSSRLKKWFLKNQSFATKLYKESDNALTFYLKIDGKPAAFMSGLFEKSRFVVPRLSINSSFSRYSPGYILIDQAIRYFSEFTEIRILDLSVGEEEYKKKLGGKSYCQLEFLI